MPQYLFWLLIHQPLPGFSADEHLGEKETGSKVCGAQKTSTEMGKSALKGQKKEMV